MGKKNRLIHADSGFKGQFIEGAFWYKYAVEISQRLLSHKDCVDRKGRWHVERSFAWCNYYRRLAKDYEKTTESAVVVLQTAYISIILAKF